MKRWIQASCLAQRAIGSSRKIPLCGHVLDLWEPALASQCQHSGLMKGALLARAPPSAKSDLIAELRMELASRRALLPKLTGVRHLGLGTIPASSSWCLTRALTLHCAATCTFGGETAYARTAS
jgi:hypothetical protein